MAKKETKSAPANGDATAPNAAATAAQRAQVAEGDRFVAIVVDGKPVEPPKKLAPQAMVIINLIRASGDDGITRKDLCDKLPAAGLVTRQPVGRIVSYYQKAIQESGSVKLVKAGATA